MADGRLLNQRALEPSNNVVIEACAGSGKTWLLVARIIRLLLAGAAPGEILAITFTRKAAQEVQARLRDWLHLLAAKDDAAVARFLIEREIPAAEAAALLPTARRLLERFLTAQPGITVSTFHGWFMKLLQSAPLTSAAATGTTLVEQTAALMFEAWQLFAEDLLRAPNSDSARALRQLFEHYGLDSTRGLLLQFLGRRAEWWAYTELEAQPVQYALYRLRERMPVAPEDDVCAGLFSDREFCAALEQYTGMLEKNGTPTDVNFARRIRNGREAQPAQRFADLRAVLLTKEGQPRARRASAAMEERLGSSGQAQLLELHERLGGRCKLACDQLAEQAMYRLNAAALLCGSELLARYQTIKRERGLLDYTDVEWRACRLLSRSDHAEYMQYKLDARYRHILLDEFQDTNPFQWQAMQAWLAAARAAGSAPSVFLVGDPKQSIYRFRRAEPRLFQVAAHALGQEFAAVRLAQEVTRRNALPIVRVVNALFAELMPEYRAHHCHQPNLPGAVRVLPLIAANAAEPAAPRWRNPLDAARADSADRRREHEARQLAQGIAEIVGRWEVRPRDCGSGRAARYEDIMLLVRARTHLEAYERELRHARIPYLSSRQGGLLDTLEARDLVALLHFLVLPSADLHLAHALRSPLFGARDEDLMLLAASPGGSWWQRLRAVVAHGAASEVLSRAATLLQGWMTLTDRLPVHDLLDRIYFEADVPRSYDAAVPAAMRLSVAANLRAFMELALATDSGRYPSLQGFLQQLESMRRAAQEEAPDEGVIAEGTNAVRILTVHGAKGLEAPIVWLLDANTEERKTESYAALVHWPPEALRPQHFSMFSRQSERGTSRAAWFENEAQLAAREELNLLYVALTRAQQALIVSGCEGQRRENHTEPTTWYRRIASAVDSAGALEISLPAAGVAQLDVVAEDGASTSAPELDAALRAPLRAGQRSEDPTNERRRRGTLLHTLLEKLAPPNPIRDQEYLRELLSVSAVELSDLRAEAEEILNHAQLRRFFDPAHYVRAFNELAYVSTAGEMRRIDRVVEFEREIWVLDYKTGELADQSALRAALQPYRDRMAEYRATVERLFPGKPVMAALVFARGVLCKLEDN